MAENKCSNCHCFRVRSYVWTFLGFLHGLIKVTLEPILKITGLMSFKRNAILQRTQSTGVSSYQITKTLLFITDVKPTLEFDPQTFKLTNLTGKPLCVMLTWMFAQQKHIDRYVQIYLEQGFDVLTLAVTPFQAMWPAKGTQVTAANAMKFLHANERATPIMLHGFSVGAYVWGEMRVLITDNHEKHQSIMKRLVAQVWDSTVDYNAAQNGIPMSLFPKSKLMQNVTSKFVKFYLKLFYNIMLIPMIRASGEFQNLPSPVPALIFVSSTDALGIATVNTVLKEKWTSLGIQVTFKCWDKSPHVQHLATHPVEYLTLLYNHMDQAGLLKNREKMNDRLRSYLK